MKKYCYKFFLMWTIGISLFVNADLIAQSRNIEGQVTSLEDGEAIPGVNIVEKNTTNGTVTDVNGNYSLSVSENAVLVFSSVGFTSEEIQVGNRSVIDLAMAPNIQQLQELVVIGFGTQDKKDITGSIASVSGDELNKIPVPSFEQALSGRAAGVQVTTGSGIPGAGASLRVRGVGSTNNSEPLYVIDGIIIGNVDGGGNTSISPLSMINPNDIESIDILKDASATAIYGARAGNGVVIITTKRGKEGSLSINFDAYTAVNVLDQNNFEMLSGPEWAQYYSDMMIETNNPDYVGKPFVDKVLSGAELETYDWLDYAYRDGSINSYNLSINSGSEKSQMYVSANYFDQEGIFLNSDLKRYTLRLNSDHKIGKILKVGNTLALARTEANTVGNLNPNGNTKDWLRRFLWINPYKPIFDPVDGDYAGLSAQDPDAEAQLDYMNEHPIWNLEQDYDRENRNRIWGSLYADLTLAEGLVFHTMGSIDWSFNKDEFRGPANTIDGAANSDETTSRLNLNSRESRTWFIENTLQYDKNFGDHNLSVMAGYQAQNNLNKGFSAGAGAFVDTEYWFFNRPVLNQEITDSEGNILATFPLAIPGVGNFENESAFVSLFGRAIYDYKDKYLLTATIRRDGSSRFGPEQRWGTFPAVSAGWRISEEFFMGTLSQVSNLKLRAGWGVSGSDNTRLYQWNSRIGAGSDQEYVFNGGVVPGAILTRLANVFLSWEEIEMLNFGVDLGMFNQRLEITIDYFDKTTNGLLLPFAPAIEVGAIDNPTGNLGEISNKGFEFALHSVNMHKNDFSWSSDFNFSAVKNEVINLPENADRFSGQNITRVGEELGALYGFETDGLFQNWDEVYSHSYQNQSVEEFDEDTGLPTYTGNTDDNTKAFNTAPGDIRFVDQNDDGFIDADNDRVIIGSTIPDFTWGFNNNLSYKGINLSVFFQGVQGVDLYNALRMGQERSLALFENKRTTILNRWQGEGTSNDVPRAVFTDPNANQRTSDRGIEDGSFVRLKNVRLSYQFPKNWLESVGLTRGGVNVYAVGTNLLTFTKYNGYDPEIGLRDSDNPETAGVDNGTYPLTRQYTIGLQVSF
ncbi:MAG: SusC/RagA family TonB-linked outer membrane protein [Candidatus Cyclobacteriaceae bacterium M3_2C_046]